MAEGSERPGCIAEVVLPGGPLAATLDFFTGRLGFRLEAIFPADAPSVAVISGHGLRLRLDGERTGDPGTIRLLAASPDRLAADAHPLTAPNGTRIEIVDAAAELVLPPLHQRFTLSRMSDEAAWSAGRAGMAYRDLIPGRLGGRFIASHIRIRDGGPVPDYVHFHKIRFQMIYCVKGWVEVVYEDQGPPFRMEPGDCVLQPPGIRHRVLSSSPGLEVVEIGCPALHETVAEHGIALPTAALRPDRVFGGQHFRRHIAATAEWQRQAVDGFAYRDIGIGRATGGLASARVVRPDGGTAMQPLRHDGELLFLFVLAGAMRLDCLGEHRLGEGDAATIPAGEAYVLADCARDLSLLEVSVGGANNSGSLRSA